MQSNDSKLHDGKVVLVTGASGGIGGAICRRFARLGARVALHARGNRQRADALADELAGERGDGERGDGAHEVFVADLRDAEAVETLVADVVTHFGRLDVVVNNAGIYELHSPAEVDFATWRARWQRTLDINLIAASNVAFCVAQHMRDTGGGRIINITSRGAFRGEPDAPAYAASKAGLNALSQSLAIALAPAGIYVFAVAPGFVETAMARPHLTGDMAESIRQQSPLRRVARADDVAYWVSCCAADDASFATGTIIDVNGASYLRS